MSSQKVSQLENGTGKLWAPSSEIYPRLCHYQSLVDHYPTFASRSQKISQEIRRLEGDGIESREVIARFDRAE
jgi:hypothetical protein